MTGRACTKMALRQCACPETVKRAAKIALIVGPLLTLINQWEVITGPGSLNWIKAGLSFAVPFSVSLCSCLMMMRKMNLDQAARED